MTARRVFAVAVLAFPVAAAPAPAAITSTYTATPPKTLTVTSDAAGDTIVFTCSSGLKINGAPPPSGAVACTEVTTLEVDGNDGADLIDVSALDEDDDSISILTLAGGEGDDDLRGRFDGGTMTLLGEGGNDTLTTPANTTQGGPGDDRLVGFPNIGSSLEGDAGADTFVLTSLPSGLNLTLTVRDSDFALSAPEVAGVQTFPWTSIEAVDLTLSDAAQTVDAAGFSGSARVLGKGGSDTLLGTANADELDGGLGNDFLDGGSGPDVYQGGPGFDQVRARDGIADSGDCGSDDDTLFVDALDSFVGCELIDAPAGPPAEPTPTPSPVPLPDTTAPVLTLGSALVSGRALRLPVTCAAGEVRCAGVLTLTATGRRGSKRRTVRLGPVALSVAGAATANVTRRMSRGQRRALRRLKRRRLRVGVDVVDAAGNRTRATQSTALSLG